MPRTRGRALVALAMAVGEGERRPRPRRRPAQRRETGASWRFRASGRGPLTTSRSARSGDPDVFMASDLGVRHGLARLGLATLDPSHSDGLVAMALVRAHARLEATRQGDGMTLLDPLDSPSPVGAMRVVSDGIGVDEPRSSPTRLRPDSEGATDGCLLTEVRRQLARLLRRRAPRVRPADGARGEPISSCRSGSELQRIPYGTTASYGEIAARTRHAAGCVRAVGLANGANPIAIIVPVPPGHRRRRRAGRLRRRPAPQALLLDLEAPSGQGSLFG